MSLSKTVCMICLSKIVLRHWVGFEKAVIYFLFYKVIGNNNLKTDNLALVILVKNVTDGDRSRRVAAAKLQYP